MTVSVNFDNDHNVIFVQNVIELNIKIVIELNIKVKL